MTPLPVVIFLTICLLTFAVPAFLMACAMAVFLFLRLTGNLWNREWHKLPVTILTCVVGWTFAYLFGMGAYKLIIDVVSGFIGRVF